MGKIIVRELAEADKPDWAALWQGYHEFYKTDLSQYTDRLFDRLIEGKAKPDGQGPFCLVAELNGKLVGFTHYLFHFTTWTDSERCYLQDLFTSEKARGNGAGRALIEAVAQKGKQRNVDQVYWMTQDFNGQARILYDKVANLTPFIKYAKTP